MHWRRQVTAAETRCAKETASSVGPDALGIAERCLPGADECSGDVRELDICPVPLDAIRETCDCFGCVHQLPRFWLDEGCPPTHRPAPNPRGRGCRRQQLTRCRAQPAARGTVWNHGYFMPLHLPGLPMVVCSSILHASIETN